MASERQTGIPRFIARDEIDELFAGASPNPGRVGCPPRDVLVQITIRRGQIDEPVYQHLQECSPCYREFRAYQDSARTERPPLPRRPVALLLSAAALVAFAVIGVWMYSHRQAGTTLAPAPEVLAVSLDLRSYSASRSFGASQQPPPVRLPARVIMLTLQLPTGSAPGRYHVEVRGSSSQPIATASGSATIVDFVTTLAMRLDLRQVPHGPASLRIHRGGEDWHTYKIVVTP